MAPNMLLFFLLISVTYLSNATPETFDCPMRQLLMEYAIEVNPTLTQEQLKSIADALNGSPLALLYKCNITVPLFSPTSINNNYNDNNNHNINTLYVSVQFGDDYINNGLSLKKPLKTIHKALMIARSLFGTKFKQILLRSGTYYIGNTLYLNHLDSNLLIKSYNNEYVNISGAKPLNNLNWKFYSNSRINNNKIYSTSINTNSLNITNIFGLRINGFRGIRARFPNVVSEETFPPNTYTITPKNWYLKSGSDYSTYRVNDPQFVRNDTNPPSFQYYDLEINGSYFDKFLPPASAPRLDNPYPIGLEYDNNILPNTPYKNVTNGIIRAWEINHWYSWMWQLDYNKSYNNEGSLYFLHNGGNQGSDPGTGDTFFIENIFEELDAINEWYYDTFDNMLYYIPNNTDINNNKYEATTLKVLFELNGNQTHPVQNVTISGMSFIDTVYTFLDEHGDPPGGGWGVQYNAAINVIGTENVTITNNLFSRLDGLGILLFSYNRNTLISHNEFKWFGDSCIVVWGNTEGYNFAELNNTNVRYSKLGINGTNGDQPRHINVSYNIAHEIGINEKQSSFYFQAISCQNHISNNIVFNGPRAGILFNDGFGGDSYVHHNIMFNLCRESSDHGPFNSWDHTPYVTKVRTGQQSITKSPDHVYNNFIISNYQADYGIDNDDCSQYFIEYNNFLVYAYWGFKNNFGGHDIHSFNNIYAYVQRCIQLYYTIPLAANKDILLNNTCIINDTVTGQNAEIFNYAFIGPSFSEPNCNGIYPQNEGGWDAQNNTVMINQGNINNTGYCNVSLAQLQKRGTELGSTVQGWPNTQSILEQARELLWG